MVGTGGLHHAEARARWEIPRGREREARAGYFGKPHVAPEAGFDHRRHGAEHDGAFVSRTGYFHFYVTAGTSFAGKTVYLQRFTLARQWMNIRALRLGTKSGRLISVRFVRSLIPHGRWSIRVFMPATEMGGGYLDSWSGTQPVVRH